MKASGGTGSSIPSLLNLASVTASNKFGGESIDEAKPQDVRGALRRRKRLRKVSTMLAKVQTPLVEANRPNKHKESERSRHQANYEARRKRMKIPKQFNPHLESQREETKDPLP